MDGPVVITVSSIALVALATAYSVALLWLRSGFRSVCREPSPAAAANLTVSVIVPARNEAENITTCLKSIVANRYPDFEVVVVDDGSEDATARLAEDLARNHERNRIRVVRLEDNGSAKTGHKKTAIQSGIDASRGDVIVTTDADVVVPEDWLKHLIARFTEGVEMVSGPVSYREGGGFLSRAVALEMLGLVAAGGGAIANGRPIMCNGANLAYRREAFSRVGGFGSIHDLATGDDTLLMFKVASGNPRSVRFEAEPGAMVVTEPASGWREFLNQRIRWASQGLDHGDRGTLVLAVLVYGFHALLLAATLAAPFLALLRWPVVAALALKIGAEGLLLHSACAHFDRKHLMKVFLPAEIVQIPYVVIVGFLGVFGSGFSWKGRRLMR